MTTLEDQYGELLQDIDLITIRKGNGNLFKINDAAVIKQWVQDVSSLPLSIDNESKGSVGTLYGVNLYLADELMVNFSTDHVNGYLLKPNSKLINAINNLLH